MTIATPSELIKSKSKELVESLIKLNPGDILFHDEALKICGKTTIDYEYYSICSTAKKTLQDNHNIVVRTKIGKGLVRLTNAQVASLKSESRRKYRRIAKKNDALSSCVDYEALSPSDKLQFNVSKTIDTMVAGLTTHKSVTRLSLQVLNNGSKPLSLAETIDHFSKEA